MAKRFQERVNKSELYGVERTTATGRSSRQGFSGLWAWLCRRGQRRAKWFLGMLFVAGTAGSFWNLHQREERLAHEFPLQGTALQMTTLQEVRKFYSEEIVNRLQP